MFETYWAEIPGWFSWEKLYERVVQDAEGVHKFVEIGVWRGRSTAYLANQIKLSEKPIFFYAFDTFAGSAEHSAEMQAIANSGTTLENIARQNLIDCGVADFVKVIRQDSATAAKRFENGTLDMVFLDGDHEYESVKADIEAWLPKIKPGGLIAGDDYQPSWPGVIRAVDELLPDRTVYSWWEYRLPT